MRAAVLLVLPALALSLAGCTKKVKESEVEEKIAKSIAPQLGGVKPKVDCPGGQDAKKGNRFACTMVAGGQTIPVEVVMVKNDQFTFRVKQ